MSGEKFSFRPALPPTAQVTEETQTLVYKLVSEDVPDDRVMLGVLRELEKNYEALIRRAVSETRSEALQDQLEFQEQADQARQELSKQTKDLKKENRSLRDQLQSIQKRLFLVEREKDHLQIEQHQSREALARIERERAEQAKNFRLEQQEIRASFEMLSAKLETALSAGDLSNAVQSTRINVEAQVVTATANPTQERTSMESSTTLTAGASQLGKESACEDAALHSSLPACSVSSATPPAGSAVSTAANNSVFARRPRWADADEVSLPEMSDLSPEIDLNQVAGRVDHLQEQLQSLQGWMLQGSRLVALAGPQPPLLTASRGPSSSSPD